MKIAMVLFKYFPYGGLQRDFYKVARLCIERGHEVDVYTMEWKGGDKIGNVRVVPVKGWSNHSKCKKFATKVNAIVLAKKYNCVIGFNKMPGLDIYYAADVCYKARIKSTRGWLSRLTSRYKTFCNLEASVFLNGSNTKILLISDKSGKEYQDAYGTNSFRMQLLPPGIDKKYCQSDDPDHYAHDRREARIKLGVNKNQFVMLLVASSFKVKGLDRILAALKQLDTGSQKSSCIKGAASSQVSGDNLNDSSGRQFHGDKSNAVFDDVALDSRVKFLVVGDDSPVPYVNMLEGIEKCVEFAGPKDDLRGYYLAADLYVHPARHENTGTVLLEAMASGLPVLTTATCGYAHYISDNNAGYVLDEPFSQKNFKEVLKGVMSGKYDLDKWRANALGFAGSADIYDLHSKIVEVIEGVCHESM